MKRAHPAIELVASCLRALSDIAVGPCGFFGSGPVSAAVKGRTILKFQALTALLDPQNTCESTWLDRFTSKNIGYFTIECIKT
jgi:hypothetical protein